MITTSYYQEFHLSRGDFNPRDFGVDLPREEFIDQMVVFFASTFRDGWTIGELLLHPREAIRLCDKIRRRFGYYDTPNDIILRAIAERCEKTNL